MRLTGIFAAGSAGIVALTLGTIASGHTDDPKASAILPPTYQGPVWRRAIEGRQLGGMAYAGGFESSGVNLESNFPVGAFAGNSDIANDIWGYVSPSGREYALVGLECGTGIVEVTDPAAATIVGTVLGACSTWGDVKTYGPYAYKVTEDSSIGIQVIDLTDVDNGNVSEAGRIADQGGIGATHNIVIDTESGFLYRVGGFFNGFGVYDLNADAVNPPQVGDWPDRYIHDAQAVTYTGPDTDYAGRQIMFACSGYNGGWSDGRLEILDVTDKSGIVTLGEAFYSNTVYSHQGWLSEDQRYFYLDDELDEATFGTETTTRIVDVSDLDNPVEVGTFTNGLFTIDHNLFVRDGLIFEANYTSGLRVFDQATDPLNPVEIAYFDTRPEDNVTDFYALWGNYPFLPSGTVIGSDEQRGLFVWTVDALAGGDPCGDADGSGVVDFGDVLAVLGAWGNAGGAEDVDGSGTVDFGDLLVILGTWGQTCP